MRLTAYTDYSLRVLMRLALRPDELTTIAEISRAYGISEHHLVKVVHALGKAGYVQTLRGHGGGLRLARPAKEIRVGEVVRRMEADLGLVACFREGESCVIGGVCGLSVVLEQARKAFFDVLDTCRLSDLVKSPAPLQQLLCAGPARRSAEPR